MLLNTVCETVNDRYSASLSRSGDFIKPPPCQQRSSRLQTKKVEWGRPLRRSIWLPVPRQLGDAFFFTTWTLKPTPPVDLVLRKLRAQALIGRFWAKEACSTRFKRHSSSAWKLFRAKWICVAWILNWPAPRTI